MSDAPRYEVYLAGETVKLLVVLDYVQGTRWKEKRREDWARRIGARTMAPGGSGGRVNDRDDARTGERLECAGLALGRLGATAMRDRSGGCVTKEHAGWG